MRAFALAPVLALLAACTAGAGHPVILSRPRLDLAALRASNPGTVPEPPAPTPEEAPTLLFRGLEGVLRPLERLHAAPLPQPGGGPFFALSPALERAVESRYRRGGYGGAVRTVVALGTTGFVPLEPAAAARLVMDPVVERQALRADALRRTGLVFALPSAQRSQYYVEILRVGKGPFRFDLRFAFEAERVDAGDGRIWLRFDPIPAVRAEHVTLYRGGCVIEPVEGGSRLTELLIVGTDIVLPFLQGALRDGARGRLAERSRSLWATARRPRPR